MNTASILVKTDPQIKKEAQKTAEELGLSLTVVINRLLKEFVKTKTISFSANELDEIPNERTRALLQQAEEDLKQGNVSPKFHSADEMIEWLHKQGVWPH
jgi:addiction module RelB/DinJ family antitoxin